MKPIFKIATKNRIYEAFVSKTKLALQCRSSWPFFASHNEDVYLRNKKWDDKYGNRRVEMWDDTNIPFCFKPGSASKRKLLLILRYDLCERRSLIAIIGLVGSF